MRRGKAGLILGGWATVFVILVSVIVCAALAARPASTRASTRHPSPGQGRAVNRAKAIADARRRLVGYEPPIGARRVHAPGGALHLYRPASTEGGPRDVDVHDIRVTREQTGKVRRYLSHHDPPGSRRGPWSPSTTDSEPSFYEYEWPELPGLVDGRTLTVEVVARPSGGSALRLDSEAGYVEPRPAGERVPPRAAYLEVEEIHRGRRHVLRTHDASVVRRTASLIDRLPIVQEDRSIECGFSEGRPVTLRAFFRATPGGRVLATTEQHLSAGSCDRVAVTVEGETERELDDTDGALADALRGLLSRR